jgi:ADP-ribosyl-[dinitrogen reductase] hydrolase
MASKIVHLPPPTLQDRYAGSLLGLACGDALGTTVEFEPRGTFDPLTDMVGKGPFGLAAGQWTDDTSMALCLAESLVEKRYDVIDQMARFVRWWREGYWSATGRCFDIGTTTRAALTRFERDHNPYAGSADPDTAGNGSLMRLAPIVLYFYPSQEDVIRHAADHSCTTHAAPEAVECCQLLAYTISRALSGIGKDAILDGALAWLREHKVLVLASAGFRDKPIEAIRGSGYAVESLEAALWCVHHTGNYRDAVLAAANLGDDADTTAAITGQIAGALYGVEAIPPKWRQVLHRREEILTLADRLYNASRTR